MTNDNQWVRKIEAAALSIEHTLNQIIEIAQDRASTGGTKGPVPPKLDILRNSLERGVKEIEGDLRSLFDA